MLKAFFNQYTLTNVLLVDLQCNEKMRMLIELRNGIKVFMLTHINKYRQATFIDINNLFGNGCNALYSIIGNDKSQLLYLMPSLELYLQSHYNTIKNNGFFIH